MHGDDVRWYPTFVVRQWYASVCRYICVRRCVDRCSMILRRFVSAFWSTFISRLLCGLWIGRCSFVNEASESSSVFINVPCSIEVLLAVRRDRCCYSSMACCTVGLFDVVRQAVRRRSAGSSSVVGWFVGCNERSHSFLRSLVRLVVWSFSRSQSLSE